MRIVVDRGAAGWLLGLVNSLYVAPKATAALLQLEDSLKTSQASFEMQPRVFYEDFRNYVLYVQDVRAGSGASQLAPRLSRRPERAGLAAHHHRRAGNRHQRRRPVRCTCDCATAASTRSPPTIRTSTTSPPSARWTCRCRSATQDETHLGRSDSPILADPQPRTAARARTSGPDGEPHSIELNKRLSYPAACLVLMLVGVPLGMSSERGGKSAGFVLTIVLVFVYYFSPSIGVALARQEKITRRSRRVGGEHPLRRLRLVLLRQMCARRRGAVISSAASAWASARPRTAQRIRTPARVTRCQLQPVMRARAAAQRSR